MAFPDVQLKDNGPGTFDINLFPVTEKVITFLGLVEPETIRTGPVSCVFDE